ncbi:MAG: glycosyltransferase family 2 protein [Oscillospiraceae bacterium]|jgi:dolichol-phosphate mannosyltransferase|nr:glycosyltransferase family 2 protein [Oscillospiraceae bacterium]
MTLSVVVPLYNEEEVILESYTRLKEVLEASRESYELIFVNDGSRDKTWELALGLAAKDPQLKLIGFSRNFGHQTAITAGMDLASGDAVVVIDADLQDPPAVILEMVKKWREGYDVVYGRRVKRMGETLFKKATAKAFYRGVNAMTDVDIPVDAGDFRLLDRKVVDALKSLPERNRYVRGLVSWVGFKQAAVDYVRQERFAGTTKYPLRKMLKLAGDAVTGFSYKPLKISTYLGSALAILCFLFLVFVVIQRLFFPQTIMLSGWASLTAIVLFFNGIMLMMLGIIGEYIGRIYDEAKGRPMYIVAEKVNFDN